jgi:chitinase
MRLCAMWLILILILAISLTGCSGYPTAQAESPAANNLLTPKIVGYIQGSSMHHLSEVNLSLLTHLIYSGIEVTNVADPTLVCKYDWNQLVKSVSAGHTNGNKVLVSLVDTSNAGNLGQILSSPYLRARLVSNINNLITTYNLDGIDIDYEYYDDPNQQTNVTLLVEDLYAILQPRGKLITVATAVYDHAVNSNAIAYVDFFNVMTYCIRFPESSTYFESVEFMNQFAANGFPSHKLIMGIPFFSTDASGNGTTYREIIDFLNPSPNQNSAHLYSITRSGKLYSVVGEELWWNGINLAQQKVDFVNSSGFGGVMVWELGQDKFNDSRSLLQTIYNEMILKPIPTSSTK